MILPPNNFLFLSKQIHFSLADTMGDPGSYIDCVGFAQIYVFLQPIRPRSSIFLVLRIVFYRQI